MMLTRKDTEYPVYTSTAINNSDTCIPMVEQRLPMVPVVRESVAHDIAPATPPTSHRLGNTDLSQRYTGVTQTIDSNTGNGVNRSFASHGFLDF